ncbi:MAG: aminopeptidase [Candidatus Thermoplasmatota archaeon]|nr:aminopeptidase [Candidatus Thermoplasmatota archaeon]MBS3789746.1 aminopeptidase [Candidatus Thermoplasmatota archaeon]
MAYDFELGKSGRTLVRDILEVEEGDNVVITADTNSNKEVVKATASEVFTAGGKPMVVWNPTPEGVGKAADPMLPQKTLAGALKEADVWIEYNEQWLLYSTVYDKVIEASDDIRYICLVEMNPDMMVRTIGRVDMPKLAEFLKIVAKETGEAEEVRVTTPAGTDLEFENHPERDMIVHSGDIMRGKSSMLPGQISWSPKFESINGKLVFDGSLVPPVGLIDTPIEMTIEAGKVVEIEGGTEAKQFEKWLASFDDENMYRLAHISYGFNPGAKLTGNIVEDERIWGGTEWGLGNVGSKLVPEQEGGIPASSHCDGICTDSSVWLDGKQLLDEGEIVNFSRLVELADQLL